MDIDIALYKLFFFIVIFTIFHINYFSAILIYNTKLSSYHFRVIYLLISFYVYLSHVSVNVKSGTVCTNSNTTISTKVQFWSIEKLNVVAGNFA